MIVREGDRIDTYMKWRYIQVNFKTAMTTHAAADQPLFDRSKPPAEKGERKTPPGGAEATEPDRPGRHAGLESLP